VVFHVVAGRFTQSVHSGEGRSNSRLRGGSTTATPTLRGRRARRPRSGEAGIGTVPALPTTKEQSFARSVLRETVGRWKVCWPSSGALTQGWRLWAFFPLFGLCSFFARFGEGTVPFRSVSLLSRSERRLLEDDAERSWLSAFCKSRLLPHWVPALGRRGIRVPMCGCDGGDSPF
jgi:hypothetical protein